LGPSRTRDDDDDTPLDLSSQCRRGVIVVVSASSSAAAVSPRVLCRSWRRYLSENRIENDGARTAAQRFRVNQALRTLSLADNRIDDACRHELRQKILAGSTELQLLL